jgi:hypothetical protein
LIQEHNVLVAQAIEPTEARKGVDKVGRRLVHQLLLLLRLRQLLFAATRQRD